MKTKVEAGNPVFLIFFMLVGYILPMVALIVPLLAVSVLIGSVNLLLIVVFLLAVYIGPFIYMIRHNFYPVLEKSELYKYLLEMFPPLVITTTMFYFYGFSTTSITTLIAIASLIVYWERLTELCGRFLEAYLIKNKS